MDEAPEPPLTARRQRIVVAGAVMVVIVVLALVAFVVARDNGDSSTAENETAGQTSSTTEPSDSATTRPRARSATTVLTLPDGSPAPTVLTRPDGTPVTTERPRRGGGVTVTTTKPRGNSGGAAGTPGPTLLPPGQTAPPVTATPTVRQAYIAAYDAKSAAIWSIAGPDGLLWDVEDDTADPFRVEDCRALKDPDEANLYELIDDARIAAEDDAVFNMQSELSGFELRNTDGSRVWSE